MSIRYEQEQKALESSSAELCRVIEAYEKQAVSMKGFLKIVKNYIKINELTPEILHEFVDEIIAYALNKSSGRRIQRIGIYYNFLGQITLANDTDFYREVTKRETA